MNEPVLIRGAAHFTDSRRVDILLEDSMIAAVSPALDPGPGVKVVDASGLTVIPGLIDVHVHGAGGCDFLSIQDLDDVRLIAGTLAKLGTTSFLGTTLFWKDNRHLGVAASAVGKDLAGANLIGLHIEGPFINPLKRGGIQPESVLPCSEQTLREILRITGPAIRIMVVAPEIPGVMRILPLMIELGIVPAFGHSDADFGVAAAGFKAGIRHVTHTFNAMRPLLHRDPGPVAAMFLDRSVTCELISDGVHVDPVIVKLFYETIGRERTVLMSDGMRTVGLPEGTFSYYGRPAETKNGTSRYSDGMLIGSSLGLLQLVKRFMRFTGCGLPAAIAAASSVPAKLLGLDSRKGSLDPGKDADLVLVDPDLNPKMTFVAGRRI